jgi:gas vesicle protein
MRQYDDYDADEPYVVIEKTSGSVSSFVLGLAVGAGIALLVAPRSGEETRRDLRRRARQMRSAAQEAAEDFTDSMVDRYEHAKRTVEEKIETARQAIEMKRRQASEAIRAGREAANQARAELEARIAETKAAYQAGTDVARGVRRTPSATGGELPSEEDREPETT